jgi:hypothetical protein
VGMGITRTEAATIVAGRVVRHARTTGTPVTQQVVTNLITTLVVTARPGTLIETCAQICNPQHTWWRALHQLQGERHLIDNGKTPNDIQETFLRALIRAGGEDVTVQIMGYRPHCKTVTSCRAAGWVYGTPQSAWSPWTITPLGIQIINIGER